MKKLLLIIVLFSSIGADAQIRRTEYDSAWQRQFTLNKSFGDNINILFTNNGDRRRQIEGLQRDTAIKAAQIASLKADSAVKSVQIANLTNSLNSLAARVKALENKPSDSVKAEEGLIANGKSIRIDTNYFKQRFSTKEVEPILVKMLELITANGARTSIVEGKLENTITKVLLLEAFREAIKKL